MTTPPTRTHRSSRLHSRRTSPRHERQARTWRRFATILREGRGGAEQRAREALGWSLRRKARGFAIPTRVERRPGYSFGWDRLTRVLKETRFPELEAKARYDERTGTEEVLLYVHYARRGRCGKAPIGRLPAFDARWMTELLQDGLGGWMNIFALQASAETAQVVIAGAWVAAHYWIDGYDDRRAARTDPWSTEVETAVGRPWSGRRGQKAETRAEEIARLTGRLRAVLQAIDVREERGQAADDLYAYAGSLTGQLEYLEAQVRSRNGRLGGDHPDNEYGGEDRGREVVFSDLESHEYWPIHRVVQ
jgi:hypothetical protein